MRTLKFNQYEWSEETWDEQRESGRYTPAKVIVWKGYRLPIGAGSSDDVDLFIEGDRLYVLARNNRLEYAGLEAFKDGELDGEIFIDSEVEGEYLNGLTAIYAAKRLAYYCD